MKIKFTKNILWIAGAFLAGAVIGSVITWLCVDKKEFTVVLPGNNFQDDIITAVENKESLMLENMNKKSSVEKNSEKK